VVERNEGDADGGNASVETKGKTDGEVRIAEKETCLFQGFAPGFWMIGGIGVKSFVLEGMPGLRGPTCCILSIHEYDWMMRMRSHWVFASRCIGWCHRG